VLAPCEEQKKVWSIHDVEVMRMSLHLLNGSAKHQGGNEEGKKCRARRELEDLVDWRESRPQEIYMRDHDWGKSERTTRNKTGGGGILR